jgi:S1-C subfamily serine protease
MCVPEPHPWSSAECAGGWGGEVILAANYTPVAGVQDIKVFLQHAHPGQTVHLTLLRDGDMVQAKVTLGNRPACMPT